MLTCSPLGDVQRDLDFRVLAVARGVGRRQLDDAPLAGLECSLRRLQVDPVRAGEGAARVGACGRRLRFRRCRGRRRVA